MFGGAIAGELGLLSIWAVFGTQPWFIRWTSSFLMGILLCFSVFLGILLSKGPPPPEIVIWPVFLFLPSIFLAAQSPLWVLRFFVSYRFVRRDHTNARIASLDGRVGVQHLMGTVSVVAIALSLARTALGLLADRPGGGIRIEEWLALLVPCGLIAIASALITLPCLWAAVLAKRKDVGLEIVALYLLTPVIVALIVAVFSGLPGAALAIPLLADIALATTLLGGLRATCACGYQMVRLRADVVTGQASQQAPHGEEQGCDSTGDGRHSR